MVSADHSSSGWTGKVWARETTCPPSAGRTVRVTSLSWLCGVAVMGLLRSAGSGPTVSGAAQAHDDLGVRGVREHVDVAPGGDLQRGHGREVRGQGRRVADRVTNGG